MKSAIIELSARASIELTEKEIAIIHHYMSYEGVAKTLCEKVSGSYTVAEVGEVVQALRETTGRIIAATGEARNFIFDDRYGSKKKRTLYTDMTIGKEAK